MKNISIGKLRGLQHCTSPQGTFTCLALDHRQNLRRANPSFSDGSKLSKFKMEVISTLAPFGTAVLLDPEVSAAQAIAEGVLPGDRGLVVSLEATGYIGESEARKVSILPGWSVEKAKRMGADMIKLLVYYHPKSGTATEIEEAVSTVAEDCLKYDLGLMLEPLSYSLKTEKMSSSEKKDVIIETAVRLTKLSGVDILKTESPLTTDSDPEQARMAFKELNQSSEVPWVILSAAVNYETYLQQVKIACEEGASGAAVGRAVWQETVLMTKEDRARFLQTVSIERLTALNTLCSATGKPLHHYYCSQAPLDWYVNY